MKQTLLVLALFIAIGFANNYSDNPEEQIQPQIRHETHLGVDSIKCPDCGDSNCIYVQIEEEIVRAGGDGTDQQIKDAAEKVFILRGITDTTQKQIVLSNYYL